MIFLTRNNVLHHCRTCLTHLGTSKEKESTVLKYHLKTTENLTDWIENLTPLRVLAASDDYPQFVCGGCFEILKDFQEFQLLTWEVNKKLTAVLENPQAELSEKNTPCKNLNEATAPELQSENYDELEMEEEFISLKVNPRKEPIEALETIKTDTNLSVFTSHLQPGPNVEVESSCINKDTSDTPNFYPCINDLKNSNSAYNTEKQKKLHQCGICRKIFKHGNHLEAHVLSSHGTLRSSSFNKESSNTSNFYPYINDLKNSNSANNTEKEKKVHQCGICRKIFKYGNRLEEHILSSHGTLPSFSCRFCHLHFTKKYHLTSHEKIHTGGKPYSCEICGRCFKRIDSWKLHRKRHDRNQTKEAYESLNKRQDKNLDKIFTPELEFESTDGIKMEMDSSNLEFINKKINDQPKAGDEKEMGTLIIDNVHSSASHVKEILKTVCETANVNTIISKKVIHQKDIDKNITNGENMMKKPQCDICQRYFSRTDALSNHISSVHKRLRPYACQFCKSCFALKITLRRHEMMHTGERPFACNICGREFAYSWNMRKHQKTHKANSKEEDYLKAVTETSQNEPNKQNSEKDSNEHSTNINNMNVIHRCHLCQKNFSFKCRLQAHMLATHKGIRPFVCEVCHLDFISKYYLKEHERTHTGERPFACDVCDSRFRRHQALRNHRKKHGKEINNEEDNMKN